ncbi:MAG: Dabb family protein [Chloroflexota bacterium]
MIQHIMLWNYKDDVTPAERASLEAELAALPYKVPSLLRLEYGPVVGGRNQDFAHCFIMHFSDMDGLAEYATHPDHVKFAGPFNQACAVQVVVDFDVTGGMIGE